MFAATVAPDVPVELTDVAKQCLSINFIDSFKYDRTTLSEAIMAGVPKPCVMSEKFVKFLWTELSNN